MSEQTRFIRVRGKVVPIKGGKKKQGKLRSRIRGK